MHAYVLDRGYDIECDDVRIILIHAYFDEILLFQNMFYVLFVNASYLIACICSYSCVQSLEEPEAGKDGDDDGR